MLPPESGPIQYAASADSLVFMARTVSLISKLSVLCPFHCSLFRRVRVAIT